MKHTYSFSISLLLSLIYLFHASAQPYVIKRLGVEDGMSSNYVVSVTQDKKGYLWIATESGLNRFDGRQFNIYTKNNSGLSGNELNVVLADPYENKVWIGTQRDGLCYFDYETETISRIPATSNYMLSNDITDLSVAADSGLWITHYHFGVDYYDRKTKLFTPYSSKNVKGLEGNNWVSKEDGNGNLYIGHHLRGLSIVSLKDRTAKNYQHDPNNPYSIPDNEVRALCIDKNKNVWVGTNNGLALFNPQSEKFITFKHIEGNENSLLSDQILDIKQMKDGTLWICTNMGGVSILNLRENTFISPEKITFSNITVTNDNHGLSGPNARSIIQDSFGNIWIGNYRGGVDFISYAQPLFNTIAYTIEKQGKINNKQVWGLWADNHQIWLGGEGELGIYEKGKKTKNFSLHECRLHPQTHINVIYQDKQERLWLGTYKNGILLYTPKDGRITRIGDKGSEFLDICSFSEDINGKIWIGTQTGIYSYFNNQLSYEKELNAQLPDIMVHGIIRDKNGKLWVGTFGKGVVVFDEDDKKLYNFTTDHSFPSNAVNYMMEDSRKRILVATREGIIIFKDVSQPNIFVSFGAKEGLENTQVRAIQEDHDGYIWISTNGGISRLDEKNKRFYNYNYHDGIPMGDFMDGSTCITPDGTLFFGSQNGACYFNPRELSSPREVSPVTITQFFIYNKQTESRDTRLPVPISNRIVELPYNQNTFNISFNVLDYTQSSQVEFSYMLEGLENAWYSTQGDNQVTFRNIPHGNYVFKVKTRFRNQEWNENAAQLTVVIAPPLWLTWYAKLGYVILFIFALYALLRFYKRKLDLESSLEVERKQSLNKQELNEERLRFYTNITHELRTPLTLILGPLEDLLSDATLSPKHANKISIIHDSATRLLNLINRILEFRKTETQNRKLSVAKGDLGQLVQEVGLRYKELNPNNKVNYHIHIETEDTEIFYDADMITIILDNLMSNAAKYTSEGDITLSLRSVEENQIKYTEISVSDTGHGRYRTLQANKRGYAHQPYPCNLTDGKDSLQDKEEGYASGADSYLTKPFSAKLLHSRINNLLETRKKIASLLALADTQPKQESAVSSLNKLDNEFLQKITQIIEENLEMEKMDIAFIADKMCMSHSTLYRKIKGLTDMSANEFIRKVKMRKGVELLMSGQYTISEIAYMIGFSSVAYFRQCFKDEYGMSPSDYVKQKQ